MFTLTTIAAWDVALLAKIATLHSESATLFFLAITYLGEWYVVVSVFVLSTLAFLYYKQWFLILPFWFATGGAMATTFLLKHFIDRARPLDALIAETGSSMPSGHATIAVALYGFLTWYLSRSERSGKKPDVPILVILIFLISFSRLYLGVHYPSDVLMGMFVGGTFLFIAISIVKMLLHKNETRQRSFHLRKK